jgi:hypothetical protein
MGSWEIPSDSDSSSRFQLLTSAVQTFPSNDEERATSRVFSLPFELADFADVPARLLMLMISVEFEATGSLYRTTSNNEKSIKQQKIHYHLGKNMFCVPFEIVRLRLPFGANKQPFKSISSQASIEFLLIKFICSSPNTSHSENIIESRTKIMRVFLSVMHQVQQFSFQGLPAHDSPAIDSTSFVANPCENDTAMFASAPHPGRIVFILCFTHATC